jgi:hypothetical protein
MHLQELISNREFIGKVSGANLKAAIEIRRPLVVFDATQDNLYYGLFEAYAGTGRYFVGLVPEDFNALTSADDIRVENRVFFFDGVKS